MKIFDKWHMPDDEEHLPEWMAKVNTRIEGRLTYQYGKYKAAMPYFGERRRAIDVGSHIGLWAYFMARDFKELECFEPCPRHIECWNQNMAWADNANLWEYALGEHEGFVALETRTANSSGDTQVQAGVEGEIPLKPLDFFKFDDVDFIKIDCEGFEEFVLRGAVETLERCKPCVLVEQKRDMSGRYGLAPQSAVKFLEEMGAKLRQEISGDFILSWG